MSSAIREAVRKLLWSMYQRLTPPLDFPDRPPPMPRAGELRRFLESLDSPDAGDRAYLDIHLDRIVTTLGLVPPPHATGRALELGTYMHMAPALGVCLEYKEVRGAYYGPLGRSDRKSVSRGGQTIFECFVDLFDAEKDRYPYDDGAFDCVLACEIFEHFLHDPMHMLFESRRILAQGGTLIVTTPNVCSATAVARTLQMSANPQLYSKYTDPRKEYAETEVGHMREYAPVELVQALQSAGFEPTVLFTTRAPGYHSDTWVLDLLRELEYPVQLRGEQMYCVAKRLDDAATTRYPDFLYEL